MGKRLLSREEQEARRIKEEQRVLKRDKRFKRFIFIGLIILTICIIDLFQKQLRASRTLGTKLEINPKRETIQEIDISGWSEDELNTYIQEQPDVEEGKEDG